jgi:hypothetical protein
VAKKKAMTQMLSLLPTLRLRAWEWAMEREAKTTSPTRSSMKNSSKALRITNQMRIKRKKMKRMRMAMTRRRVTTLK